MHNKKHSYSSTTVSLEYKSNFCYQYLRENFLGVFMTNIELKEYWEELLSIYKGIIFNNCNFAGGINGRINYNFDCPQFYTLKEKYKLEILAKRGRDFERAKNLLSFFAPRINHKSDFQNDINCNAMDLLEYCLDKPDNGINCLNKSKILQECCLALGIYARRVWLMPYSPYDTDNHVVVEIYDFYLGKWIMLDMSANGYFVNSDGVPLSVLEIRDKFAANEICKFVKTSAVHDIFFSDMQMECLYYKQYFAKNLCYLFVETQNEFSDNKKRLSFIPYNFDLTKNLKYKSFIEEDIPPIGNISILLNAPK